LHRSERNDATSVAPKLIEAGAKALTFAEEASFSELFSGRRVYTHEL
jgi:hypothetical protein